MLAWLLRVLFGSDDLGQIEHWTPERANEKQRATFRYLGIRPEPIYTWSRKFRKTAVQSRVLEMKRRRA